MIMKEQEQQFDVVGIITKAAFGSGKLMIYGIVIEGKPLKTRVQRDGQYSVP